MTIRRGRRPVRSRSARAKYRTLGGDQQRVSSPARVRTRSRSSRRGVRGLIGAEAGNPMPGYLGRTLRPGRVMVMENAPRFASGLIVQETGFRMLQAAGFTLISADDLNAFTASTPMRNLVRQVLGAVAQFEKANLASKLKAARDR